LAAAALVAVCVGGLWAAGGFGHEHDHVRHGHAPSRPRLVTDDGLEVALVGFERLADGHAGVNSPVLPMNSRGMPMAGGMGPIGDAIEKGQERIAVSVLLHNKGTAVHDYTPDGFSLSSKGRPVELLANTTSTAAPGGLVAGARLSSTVYFVVPEGAWPLALSYDGKGGLSLKATRPAPVPPGGAHGH